MHTLKTIISIFLSFFILFSCTTKPLIHKSGTPNLDDKEKKLIANTANKNDVYNILGLPILKEYPDELVWIYTEIEKKNNLLASKDLVKNNILIIQFNNKGIIINKKFLTMEDMKKINFTEDLTQIYSLNNSFHKRLFSSIKKRYLSEKNQNNQ